MSGADPYVKRVPNAEVARVSWGRAPQRNFLDFNSLKSYFLVFWVIQTGYLTTDFFRWKSHSMSYPRKLGKKIFHTIFQISTWKVFSKYVYYEVWPISVKMKTVETSVDPRLYHPFKSQDPLKTSQDWSPYITLRNKLTLIKDQSIFPLGIIYN